MAFFSPKTWLNRLSTYPTRRRLTIQSESTGEIVADVSREEGTVSQAGDAFSAGNMNNLETRINTGFTNAETQINNAKGMVAPVETGSTASRTYYTDDRLVYNGLLYRAKTTISSGTAFSVGGNIELSATVQSQLATLNTQLTQQFITDSFSISYTLTSGQFFIEKNIEKTGYKPLGIIEINFNDRAEIYTTLVSFSTDRTTAQFGGYYAGSTSITHQLKFRVLYQKRD